MQIIEYKYALHAHSAYFCWCYVKSILGKNNKVHGKADESSFPGQTSAGNVGSNFISLTSIFYPLTTTKAE